MSRTSELFRAVCTESDTKRDEKMTIPENVERFDNIRYGEDPKWQSLDVYRPKNADKEKLPVIISVHGGGWVYGSKEVYQYYCMDLAKRGFAVVNFSYRLAPENKYPAPLEDMNAVMGWVMVHADAYGLDTNNLFAVGDSAGAHILGLYECICTNPEFAETFDFKPPEGLFIKAVALNCGSYDPGVSEGTKGSAGMIKDLIGDFLPGGGTAEEMSKINVLKSVTKEFPPSYVMTCTGDFLMSQAPLLAEKLVEAQVPFVYRFFGDSRHELGHVFHCDILLDAAGVCNDEECAFFREFISD